MALKQTILTACLFIFDSLSNAAVITPLPPSPTKNVVDRAILAIVPTTAGQIGVNPVLLDLGGNPDTYIGEIYGTDTEYITLSETVTKVCH